MNTVDGTLLVFMGPPGCGKTYNASWCALRCARRNRLPFLAIDPAGELVKYVQGFREFAENEGDTETAEWLSDDESVRVLQLGDASEGLYSYDEALNTVERLINHHLAEKTTEPAAVVFLDELAAIREQREKFQNITIPRGRNAGVLFVGTCQTNEGMTPKARACVRAAALWKSTRGGVTIFDRWVDNSHLAMPRSEVLTYVTPWDTAVHRTTFTDDALPALFTEPVTPTQLVKRRL